MTAAYALTGATLMVAGAVLPWGAGALLGVALVAAAYARHIDPQRQAAIRRRRRGGYIR